MPRMKRAGHSIMAAFTSIIHAKFIKAQQEHLLRTGSVSFVYLRAKNRNHHIRMVTYGSSLLAAFSGVAGRLPRGFLTLPPRFTFQADLSPRHAVT